MVFFLKQLFGGDTKEKKEKKPLDQQKFTPEHYETLGGKQEHWYHLI